jgi:hypothetical protein
MKEIKNQHYETERSLYDGQDLHLLSRRFEGPSDGESPLKESTNIFAESCYFDLRYPFWHNQNLRVKDTTFTEKSRAAFWYDDSVVLDIAFFMASKRSGNARMSL